MEKLYVNEVGADGDVSTVGLFYSHAEAQKVVELLRANPEHPACRYEIVRAERHILAERTRTG
jgi:hypothetical protein